jgi:hypothetical protein
VSSCDINPLHVTKILLPKFENLLDRRLPIAHPCGIEILQFSSVEFFDFVDGAFAAVARVEGCNQLRIRSCEWKPARESNGAHRLKAQIFPTSAYTQELL